MYRGVEYDKKDATALAIVGVFCVFTFVGWRVAASSAERKQRASQQAVSAERAALAELEPFTKAAVEEATKKVDAWRDQLLTQDEWSRKLTALSPDWVFQPGTVRQLNGCFERRGTLRFLSSSVADWPKIVKTVEGLEAHPSIALARVDIRATGDKLRRSFDNVRFEVVYLTKD